MIVEFIGCTGSGKTTLIQAVQTRLAKISRVAIAGDLATGLIGLQCVQNPTAQNFVQELIGFPIFIRSFPRYKDFNSYTMRILLNRVGLSFTFINNFRSLVRKISIYEFTQHYKQDRIILLDEGPVLVAHMFAFDSASMTENEIACFASMLPLPDLLVYVKASITTMVQRTLKRADKPRELKMRDQTQIEQTIQRITNIFDQLVEAENIRSRLLIVDNSDFPAQSVAVDCVVESILEFQKRNL